MQHKDDPCSWRQQDGFHVGRIIWLTLSVSYLSVKRPFFTPGKTLCLTVIPSRVPRGLALSTLRASCCPCFIEPLYVVAFFSPVFMDPAWDKLSFQQSFDVFSCRAEMSATYHKKTVYSLSWGPPCPKAGTYSYFNPPQSCSSFAWNSKIAARSGEKFSEKMMGLSSITSFSFLRSEITDLTIACPHLSILSHRAHWTHSQLIISRWPLPCTPCRVFFSCLLKCLVDPASKRIKLESADFDRLFCFVFLANVNAWEFYLPATKLHFKIGLRDIAWVDTDVLALTWFAVLDVPLLLRNRSCLAYFVTFDVVIVIVTG